MMKSSLHYLRGIIAALMLAVQPVNAAGTIPVALAQQVNSNGVPLAGCLLYLYVTGTVATPQIAYQDIGLSSALPWPVLCDANGRLPMFYVADGSIHPRLTDASGAVQFDYPSMLVIGPSGGGGGGGGTIDPTTIATSGDVKFRPTSETLTGWVKLNGTTIGSGISGATGRANADTQNLFIYLWNNCVNAHCPVSTGRGATGLADFSANKTLTLPDWRGRLPVGLDDMGTSAAGRLLAANVTSGGGDGVTTAAATGGTANTTLAQSALPNIAPTITIIDPGHTHIIPAYAFGSVGTAIIQSATTGGQLNNESTASHTTGITATSSSINGNVPQTVVPTVSPFMLGTWFMKL